jgi:cysteine-rich repeat protein
MHTNITTCMSGDGCCPSGCTHATDTDCAASCGNGVVDPGETCDIAITTGAGKCPTLADCNDNNACTTDTLLSAGTCMASCNHTPIIMCVNGDGCCPSGCNALNDNNCQAVCGNGILEPGEACDDGNTMSLDGCSSTCQLESYRVTQLVLEDPHVWIDAGILGGCTDATNSAPLGQPGVNQRIATSISSDTSPMDGFLDLNVLFIFRPPNLAPNASTPISVTFGKCTAPESTTTCRPGTMQTNSTATNHSSGQCLGVLPNTHNAMYGNIVVPNAPCFDTPDGVTLTVQLNGIMIPLQNARVAATYSGNPATQLVNGEIRGFISETDANNTTLPTSLPFVGGHPLSSVLAGGVNCCRQAPAPMGDKDVGPDGSTLGWYFYLSFTAAPRPYTDMP